MDELDKLKDIKSIVEIDVFNPLWIVLVFALFLIAILAFYLLKRKPKKYKFRKSAKELAKERIDSIDFSDSKSVAYIFAKDVAQFIDEENRSEYEKIEKELEVYKYKKEVPKLSKELEDKIREFIKGIKWKI